MAACLPWEESFHISHWRINTIDIDFPEKKSLVTK